MSAFVITAWNGEIHTAVEHYPASKEPKLGRELKRIPLKDAALKYPCAVLGGAFANEIVAETLKLEKERS